MILKLSITPTGDKHTKKVKYRFSIKQIIICLENYFTMERYLRETNQISKWTSFRKKHKIIS